MLFVMQRNWTGVIWKEVRWSLGSSSMKKPLKSWLGRDDLGIREFCLSCCSLLAFAELFAGFECLQPSKSDLHTAECLNPMHKDVCGNL